MACSVILLLVVRVMMAMRRVMMAVMMMMMIVWSGLVMMKVPTSTKVIMTIFNMRALGGFVTLTHENTLNR